MDLRLLIFFAFIIRKLRLALVVCLGFLQCGIPHRFYRFYCCLAAHQRTRKKDSAEPSFPILWTPPHPPGDVRCGGKMYAAAVDRYIVSCIQVQVAYPQFRMLCSYLCSGWDRSRFSRGVGLVSFVFHWWWIDCTFLRLRSVLLWSIVGITADRDIVPISLEASPFHQLCRVQKCRKNAFVRLKL